MDKVKTNLQDMDNGPTGSQDDYELYLYVAGMTPKSVQALAVVRKFCDDYLAGRFVLKVIDIYQQPELASAADIKATPTLIKKHPLPLRKLVGGLSDPDRILKGIDLKP